MNLKCRCGKGIDVAALGESLTIDLLTPAQAAVARKLRAGILAFFEWTIDDVGVVRCSSCSPRVTS